MEKEKTIELITCYYGQDDYSKSGVIRYQFLPTDHTFKVIEDIHVGGKLNFVLSNKNRLYVPILREKETGILVYTKNNSEFIKTDFIKTKYFYSYGVIKDERKGYFSSFSSGLDTIIDINKKEEIDVMKYQKGGISHYINTLHGQYVYALDNGLDNIYIYKDVEDQLHSVKTISFENEAPRLMPLHPNKKWAYVIMERSNQIVAYETEGFTEIQRVIVPDAVVEQDFCGGITISEDGKYLAISIRGKNEICLFKIQDDGILTYLSSLSCGDMPRDLTSQQDYIFITCSNSNQVEVMQIENDVLKKVNATLSIDIPITFANS